MYYCRDPRIVASCSGVQGLCFTQFTVKKGSVLGRMQTSELNVFRNVKIKQQ